jgi:ABC-type branched-subunit amino acid transport system substrate-binding protein
MLRIQAFFKLNLIFTFLLLLNTSVCLAEQLTTVKIGLIYPLTGTMSSFGQDMALALPLLEKNSTMKIQNTNSNSA